MTTERHPRSLRFSRREAIRLLGVSAGFVLGSAWDADAAGLMDWRTATSAKTRAAANNGSSAREVLYTPEQWDQLKASAV